MAERKLPAQLTSLIQHVELHKNGWWDKSVQRLVLSAIWLSGHSVDRDCIENVLSNEFYLQLPEPKLTNAIRELEKQDLLISLPDGQYRIPNKALKEFEAQLAAAEATDSEAETSFNAIMEAKASKLAQVPSWEVFTTRFLIPLVKQAGVNTYNLLVGKQLAIDNSVANSFLEEYAAKDRGSLREVIATFLDPKNQPARSFVGQLLHAHFCVEASGLSAKVIEQLSLSSQSKPTFQIFVDTNFLFSLLALHENPSNESANGLRRLIQQLESAINVKLYITPRTIKEAQGSIQAAREQVIAIPSAPNITNVALKVGLSGMAEKFFMERSQGAYGLSADDWFNPYLKDFASVARSKGIELCNEKLDSYATRQDVVDTINVELLYQKHRPAPRQKSYEQVAHDAIL